MATATTPKRSRKPATSKPPKASTTEKTEQVTPTVDTDSNGPDLTGAYWQAISDRDQTTGEIPAVQLDMVKVTYRAADPRKRANLVKSLTLEASAQIVNDSGEIDPGLARAIKILSAVLADAREETTRAERPPHDPVPEVAGILAAVDKVRDDLLVALTDDQRQRLPDVDVSDDAAAQTAGAAVTKALDKIRDRALNGRNGHSGPRTSAADTATAIRNAVQAADDPLTFSQLAEAANISASTVYSRWHNDNTPGVKATEDAQGNKVFQATAA